MTKKHVLLTSEGDKKQKRSQKVFLVSLYNLTVFKELVFRFVFKIIISQTEWLVCIWVIVQALYWINPELIATKGIFWDLTSTGTLEHHIKNVSKSTLGKLLKIVVLKHRVSYLHGSKAWNKL